MSRKARRRRISPPRPTAARSSSCRSCAASRWCSTSIPRTTRRAAPPRPAAFAIRRPTFKKLKAQVIGVSKDSVDAARQVQGQVRAQLPAGVRRGRQDLREVRHLDREEPLWPQVHGHRPRHLPDRQGRPWSARSGTRSRCRPRRRGAEGAEGAVDANAGGRQMASVLISGAGPIGLTMANELARYGVAVASSTRPRPNRQVRRPWCCGPARSNFSAMAATSNLPQGRQRRAWRAALGEALVAPDDHVTGTPTCLWAGGLEPWPAAWSPVVVRRRLAMPPLLAQQQLQHHRRWKLGRPAETAARVVVLLLQRRDGGGELFGGWRVPRRRHAAPAPRAHRRCAVPSPAPRRGARPMSARRTRAAAGTTACRGAASAGSRCRRRTARPSGVANTVIGQPPWPVSAWVASM